MLILKKISDYIKVKIFNSIDSKIWKFLTDDFQSYLMYYRFDSNLINKFYPSVDVPNLNPNNLEDKQLIENFTAYIYNIQTPVIIEPLYGWVISKPFTVFDKSFACVHDPWDKPKRKPSTIQYVTPHKTIKLDSCISIRYNWSNYYHFLIDTLSQVHLANEKIPLDVPILVPYFFTELKYVADFIRESDFLKGRKIIVQQKNEYYKVKNLYICKDTFYSDSIFKVVNSFGNILNTDNSRIFLKRGKNQDRNIKNIEEVEQLIQQYGFKVIDTDGLDMKRQVEIFASADIIIGDHGAGLTNIVFRNDKPLRLLELFPGNKTPEHYKNLCINLNYKYSSLVCGDIENNQYYVNPNLLKDKLIEFLN